MEAAVLALEGRVYCQLAQRVRQVSDVHDAAERHDARPPGAVSTGDVRAVICAAHVPLAADVAWNVERVVVAAVRDAERTWRAVGTGQPRRTNGTIWEARGQRGDGGESQ